MTAWNCRRDPLGFVSVFDPRTGSYVRSNQYVGGKDTGRDPFRASFPELLDIGIMGRCANARNCKVGCYQGGRSEGSNMSLAEYKEIIKQCVRNTFQVALGGAGSPDEHEHFEEILKVTRRNGIVPNYTTSGFLVDERTARITRKFCGAVAVSWYRESYTYSAIDHFLNAGCTTNIHFVLSKSSLDDAIQLLSTYDRPINALIFLLYKPVGKGTSDNVLTDSPKLREFLSLVTAPRPIAPFPIPPNSPTPSEAVRPFKIGFDSCSVPLLLSSRADVDPMSVDSCEGARFSAYISANMVMSPCSFDRREEFGMSLRDSTIKRVWDSPEFERFREKLKSCVGCPTGEHCLGPCPLVPEITACRRK